MIFQNVFFVRLIVLPILLTVNVNKNPAKTLILDNTYVDCNKNLFVQNNEINKSIFLASSQQNSCNNISRPLNPDVNAQKLETELDRYFRIAYNSGTAGDFNTAIINYHRAFESANCECDRSHAQVGEQAAEEAKELLKKEGIDSKPTQFFWSRLQELTQSLSCIITQ